MMLILGAPIPTVSEWGLIVMAILLLTAGTLMIRRFVKVRRTKVKTTRV